VCQGVVDDIAAALRLEAAVVSARLSVLLRQVDLAGAENAAAAASSGSADAAPPGYDAPFARVYAAFAAARSGAGSWDTATREMVRATASEVVVHGLARSNYHDLESAVDSFRTLYCRRCHVFDCHLHGCGQLLPDGDKRVGAACEPDASAPPCSGACVLACADADADEPALWTTMEESLFATASKIHGRHTCRIARVIGTRTCQEVRRRIVGCAAPLHAAHTVPLASTVSRRLLRVCGLATPAAQALQLSTTKRCRALPAGAGGGSAAREAEKPPRHRARR
jgi:hypothetical protein